MFERKSYCYRFLDEKNNVVYVGKTVNLANRMKNHFSKKSHLAHTDLYKQVQRIEYITCKDEFQSLQNELYYINLYKPRYNSQSKIKQLIKRDPSIKDNWKVWKVIKPMDSKQAQINYRREKYLPFAMSVFFIVTIIVMLNKF